MWSLPAHGAEVAQPGRALDLVYFSVAGGEAEDRVVAGSNPALGTTPSNFISPRHYYFRFLKNFAPSESIRREAFKGADCGGAHVFQSEKVSHMGRGVRNRLKHYDTMTEIVCGLINFRTMGTATL